MASVIDASVVESLKALDDESGALLRQLIQVYTRDGQERVQMLEAALSASDWKVVSSQAHALKSSSANLGALELAELCKKVEEMTREPAQPINPALVTGLVKDLKTAYIAASQELLKFL